MEPEKYKNAEELRIRERRKGTPPEQILEMLFDDESSCFDPPEGKAFCNVTWGTPTGKRYGSYGPVSRLGLVQHQYRVGQSSLSDANIHITIEHHGSTKLGEFPSLNKPKKYERK